MTKEMKELLRQLIDAERLYFRRLLNRENPKGYISPDCRLIEVGACLPGKEKRKWVNAANRLEEMGLAEWAYPFQGSDPPIMLRLAHGGKPYIEEPQLHD